MAGIRPTILTILTMAVLSATSAADTCGASMCGANAECVMEPRCKCQQGYSRDPLTGCRATSKCTDNGKETACASDDVEAKPGEFPWHVGVFSNIDGEFRQFCSGNLISKKLVLTVAHCVSRSSNPANYKVAAGKFHRSWDHMDPTEQRRDVESIIVEDTYDGASRNYANDIAVLVLKDEVLTSEVVKPINVDLDHKYVNLQLKDGVKGHIAAWGFFPDGAPMDLLRKRVLPYTDFEKCYREFPSSFRPYFTADKFCAGNVGETEVCYRDSGSGLTFPQEGADSEKQWYVQGLVSLGVPARGGGVCTNHRELFTRVASHTDWLRDVLSKH